MAPPPEPRPWWDRALDPLRTEEAMFGLLVRIAIAAAVLVAVVLLVRAVT